METRLDHERMHNRLNSKVQLIRFAVVRDGDRDLLMRYRMHRYTRCNER